MRHEKGKSGWLGWGRKLFWSWWLWVVAAVMVEAAQHGNAAAALAGVGFFFYLVAPREHVPHYGLDSKYPIDSDEFLASVTGATGVPLIPGNKVSILTDGDEFYPSMLEAIAGARKTITIETYIYWNSEIGRHFASALAERRHAGVTVKILLDAFGSSSIGRNILKTFKDSCCEVVWYNRMWLRTLANFNQRNHRKSLIVDGRIAFTGGAGIADQWTGNAQDPRHWHDIMIRVEGPGAMKLQTGFAQNWLETTGELINGEGFFPSLPDAGGIAVQMLLSSPKSGSSAIRTMYYLSIISARHTIYISNPYFVPDDSGVQILVEAKKRGVDVKIMVAGTHNDMRISRYASNHLYGKLLEAGIEIYEYNKTMLHQKTMVVDTSWITVGTTNFDTRSFALDEESNVCAYDRKMAEELEAIFRNDAQSCRRVAFQQWRHRGFKQRLFGAACVFLKEQI
ncbi:MAG TPA: phospholipase D-like domain-containing protein [Terriglobia bacterium]|jgi:cardiolipin synthase